jgi:hypothetical protein
VIVIFDCGFFQKKADFLKILAVFRIFRVKGGISGVSRVNLPTTNPIKRPPGKNPRTAKLAG